VQQGVQGQLAARRTTFGKLQRDRDKKARANAKRERRMARPDEEEPVATERPADPAGQAETIESLRVLHERFEDGAVGFEEFEEQKAALLARLTPG
jgi:hypothetical protein